jgi:hypothetical protein
LEEMQRLEQERAAKEAIEREKAGLQNPAPSPQPDPGGQEWLQQREREEEEAGARLLEGALPLSLAPHGRLDAGKRRRRERRPRRSAKRLRT